MEFEFTWIDPSLVVSRTSGLASAEGFSALYEQLVSQPEFQPGVKVLSDHTKLDVSALTAADIEKIADARVLFIGSIGVSSAVVVGPHSPAKYGLARMFEAFSDGENDARVGVFETFDDAMAWLQADDASSGK
jgi:hypothetical protein